MEQGTTQVPRDRGGAPAWARTGAETLLAKERCGPRSERQPDERVDDRGLGEVVAGPEGRSELCGDNFSAEGDRLPRAPLSSR